MDLLSAGAVHAIGDLVVKVVVLQRNRAEGAKSCVIHAEICAECQQDGESGDERVSQRSGNWTEGEEWLPCSGPGYSAPPWS